MWSICRRSGWSSWFLVTYPPETRSLMVNGSLLKVLHISPEMDIAKCIDMICIWYTLCMLHTYIYIYIWGFPEMGVPPNHLFIDGFSIITHCRKPPYRCVCLKDWLRFLPIFPIMFPDSKPPATMIFSQQGLLEAARIRGGWSVDGTWLALTGWWNIGGNKIW